MIFILREIIQIQLKTLVFFIFRFHLERKISEQNLRCLVTIVCLSRSATNLRKQPCYFENETGRKGVYN